VAELTDLPQIIDTAYGAGLKLAQVIEAHLDTFPRTPMGLPAEQVHAAHDETCEALRDRATSWFNVVAAHIVPFTAYAPSDVTTLMHQVAAAIRSRHFYPEYRADRRRRGFADDSTAERVHAQFNVEVAVPIEVARIAAKTAMGEALRIVRTAASVLESTKQLPKDKVDANTAFILMWMSKTRPELVDVHVMVKEVFAEFRIDALRADEIQHQDSITDVILKKIQRSEYLFADLTGARPNVYYEVGYAHALGKRPFLFRRANTKLHFDLSVHNVPEYKNITDLRTQLRGRLEAIFRQTERKIPDDVHAVQQNLLAEARERLHALMATVAPDLALDLSTLAFGGDGLYELLIYDEDVYHRMDALIDRLIREANLGMSISLRCPPLEAELRAERDAKWRVT